MTFHTLHVRVMKSALGYEKCYENTSGLWKVLWKGGLGYGKCYGNYEKCYENYEESYEKCYENYEKSYEKYYVNWTIFITQSQNWHISVERVIYLIIKSLSTDHVRSTLQCSMCKAVLCSFLFLRRSYHLPNQLPGGGVFRWHDSYISISAQHVNLGKHPSLLHSP